MTVPRGPAPRICIRTLIPSLTRPRALSHSDSMPRYTLETIVLVLVILWLLGWLIVPFAGNLIHLLIVLILVVVLIRLLQGRNPL